MKRVFYSIIPMALLIIALSILVLFEFIFMDQIMNIFNIEEVVKLNSFNNVFVLFLGGIAMYVLSKYTMEINERIFRMFTFFLNFLGIIVIIFVFICRGIFS